MYSVDDRYQKNDHQLFSVNSYPLFRPGFTVVWAHTYGRNSKSFKMNSMYLPFLLGCSSLETPLRTGSQIALLKVVVLFVMVCVCICYRFRWTTCLATLQSSDHRHRFVLISGIKNVLSAVNKKRSRRQFLGANSKVQNSKSKSPKSTINSNFNAVSFERDIALQSAKILLGKKWQNREQWLRSTF